MPEYSTIIAYILAFALLLVLIRAFMLPLRFALRGAYHLLAGAAMIWIVNLAGSMWGFHLGLNPISSLVAGYLGIPGIVLLSALHLWVL